MAAETLEFGIQKRIKGATTFCPVVTLAVPEDIIAVLDPLANICGARAKRIRALSSRQSERRTMLSFETHRFGCMPLLVREQALHDSFAYLSAICTAAAKEGRADAAIGIRPRTTEPGRETDIVIDLSLDRPPSNEQRELAAGIMYGTTRFLVDPNRHNLTYSEQMQLRSGFKVVENMSELTLVIGGSAMTGRMYQAPEGQPYRVCLGLHDELTSEQRFICLAGAVALAHPPANS